MTLEPWIQLLVAAVVISLLMAALWLLQLRTGNAGTADVAWSGSIGLAGVFYALTGSGDPASRWLCGVLAAVWSGRLCWYLFRRVVGHPEEGRYVSMRQRWGTHIQTKMFFFFQLQAAAAVFFSLPYLVLSQQLRGGWRWQDGLGLALWAVGIAGVALADRQLAVFRNRPENRGRTCRHGLWRYSRHPNYFFEWLHWCAYIPLSLGATGWWLTILVPLLLLYLFFFVTGIPLTEAQALASRGEEYRRYQRATSVFVPWFPRSEEAGSAHRNS